MHTQISHVSVYADDPRSAASTLAMLIGGQVTPFPPHKGGWVCFLSTERTDWSHEFIEFYPRNTQLLRTDGATRPRFAPMTDEAAMGAGTHINLTVPMSASDIEAACQRAGVTHGWRWAGLMDVWIEERLMIELVPLK